MEAILENPKSADELLLRINRTIELIRLYDNGIKQAKELDAPVYLIQSKQRMKGQLVDELKELLAEMDVQVDLKIAA
jgi:hypothetical protein